MQSSICHVQMLPEGTAFRIAELTFTQLARAPAKSLSNLASRSLSPFSAPDPPVASLPPAAGGGNRPESSRVKASSQLSNASQTTQMIRGLL
jgi:hypothetical protein